jgi:CoA:oxalate CoA-transferase
MSPTDTSSRQQEKPGGPLSGVTVIDLTRVLAGPYCTMILADLGARVIKVEHPETGDDSRHFGPFMNGQSAYFGSLNRGKESIALNLKDNADKAIFEKLLASADVLVENYRGGTMEKLGFGWDTLHERFPRLIYASASGFGHTGPYMKRPAYDMVVQAMGGIMSVTGHPDQPPVRVGTSVGDITAGLFTAVGINGALLHREKTGEAIKVDVGMLDCQVAILENAIARYAATGEVAGPLGARHPSITPFAAFEAKDGWIIIAAGNDTLFRRMCEAIGAPELPDDPRFVTNGLRTDNEAALSEAINAALRARTVDQWLAMLEKAGVPCGPINAIDQVLSDPHVLARNMVVTSEDPDSGKLLMAGNPIKMSGFADPETRRPAPKLDADRAAILKEIGGKS